MPNGVLEPAESNEQLDEELIDLNIDLIDPNPEQPREDVAEADIPSLVESILEHGMKNKPRVIKVGERYQLLGGERRLLAAKAAGWKILRCILVHGAFTPSDQLLDQIVDNVDRVDLRPGQLARSYRRLLDLNRDKGWDEGQLSQKVKRSLSFVEDTLSLLTLPEDVLDTVGPKGLPVTFAYEIAKLPSHEEMRAMRNRILHDRLTAAELRALVRRRSLQVKGKSTNKVTRGTRLSIQVRRGTRVSVVSNRSLDNVEVGMTIYDALRQQIDEVLGEEAKAGETPNECPRLSAKNVANLVATFADAGANVDAELQLHLGKIAPLIITQFLRILDSEEPVVRREAEAALTNLDRETRLAVHYFASLLKGKLGSPRETE